MATIYHQVGILGSLGKVYKKLASTDGLAQWWTSDTRGRCAPDGTIDFYFGEFKMSMLVLEMKVNELVRWRCTGGDSQWVDTEITFSLRDDKKQILVDFSHSKWDEPTELFRHCSTKWAVFLLSLKDLVEKGEGRPAPNDIHINHF